ncbi:hypothetical protein KY284_013763 [Solanum tuberosum]|nr:hypothetical protein KY284_013763 [Solanum tuberosum]
MVRRGEGPRGTVRALRLGGGPRGTHDLGPRDTVCALESGARVLETQCMPQGREPSRCGVFFRVRVKVDRVPRGRGLEARTRTWIGVLEIWYVPRGGEGGLEARCVPRGGGRGPFFMPCVQGDGGF